VQDGLEAMARMAGGADLGEVGEQILDDQATACGRGRARGDRGMHASG
jgi:hypothetical protein